MKKLLSVIFLVVILFLACGFWYWDGIPPAITWGESSTSVGLDSRILIEASDQGGGLQSVEVVLLRKGERRTLVAETYSAPWPWQEGFPSRSVALSPKTSFQENELSEGEFGLEVTVRDQPNFWFWWREVSERRDFRLDLTPPGIVVQSSQHYIRQGGSEAILYAVSEDATASGVQVGEHSFTGHRLPQGGPGAHLCLFALPHHEPPAVEMFVWAEDAAGNRNRTTFWKKTFPVRFRKRDIRLTDSLMQAVVPDILARTPQIPRDESLLSSFLKINGDLRRLNHERLQELCRQSSARMLWKEPFLQLSNSEVESAFADYRSYYYQGEKVDEQTHLGFDLASLANSPVECANDGMVVLTDYLGIYGNTVVVDHGLGLFSLYGHLSSILVQEGQPVQRGQVLGRTGQTGLAAGDHLHFSMILQGVQINPIEWWDRNWVRIHVLDRISSSGGS